MSDDSEPIFSVVNGTPTDDELAAVLTVLTMLQAGSGTSEKPRPSGWSAYWRSVRPVVPPGPGAWRMSGRPQ